MKKSSLFVIIACAALLFSCVKKNNLTGGSWTFKGQTYTSAFTDWVLGDYVASTGLNKPAGTLTFIFAKSPSTNPADSSYPPAGVYYVTQSNSPADSNQVYVALTTSNDSDVYVPTTTACNINSYITVTRPGSETSISLTNLELINIKSPANALDSAVLNANIYYLH